MIEITTKTWIEHVPNSEIPVLIEVYSEGCVLCKMLVNQLQRVETEHPEIKVCRMLYDEPVLSGLDIEKVPTLLYYRGDLGLCVMPRLIKYEDIMKEVKTLDERAN